MPEAKEEKEDTGGAAASIGPQEEEPEPLAGALYAKPEYKPPEEIGRGGEPHHPEGGYTVEEIDKLISEASG
eukprot:1370351-Prorocentrum_lima.AAC.1